MFSATIYADRRRRLLEAMRLRGSSDGLVLFLAHSESPINYANNCYPFRQDSNWLYFLGLTEPDMAALVDLSDGSTTVFGEELSMDELVWTGPRPSLAELADRAGATRGLPSAKAVDPLSRAAALGLPVYVPPFCRAETEARATSLLAEAGLQGRRADPFPLLASIVALREIKEEFEVRELEKAVEASVDMHSSLLSALRPGWTEARAAQFVAERAAARGCSMSFAPIATLRGEILHSQSRSGVCGKDDSFLLDAGAETPEGYAGDLTTSFPVGGGFGPRKAELYSLLLQVFGAATEAIAPEVPFLEVHRAASLRLASGLVDLGLMRGDAAEIVEAGAHALFFPHGLGHMIGLDVHDMEGLGEDLVGYGGLRRSEQFGLKSLRLAKPLKAGMVHSVEPGIYFIPGLIERWKIEGKFAEFIDYAEVARWEGCGGMRIEEDWLVLPAGGRRLGPELDKSLAAIEAARRVA